MHVICVRVWKERYSYLYRWCCFVSQEDASGVGLDLLHTAGPDFQQVLTAMPIGNQSLPLTRAEESATTIHSMASALSAPSQCARGWHAVTSMTDGLCCCGLQEVGMHCLVDADNSHKRESRHAQFDGDRANMMKLATRDVGPLCVRVTHSLVATAACLGQTTGAKCGKLNSHVIVVFQEIARDVRMQRVGCLRVGHHNRQRCHEGNGEAQSVGHHGRTHSSNSPRDSGTFLV
jgi:hypothetical protein